MLQHEICCCFKLIYCSLAALQACNNMVNISAVVEHAFQEYFRNIFGVSFIRLACSYSGMANKKLDERCRSAFEEISRDVRELRGIAQHVKDINYKLGHILEELREDYFYTLGMRQLYDAYGRQIEGYAERKEEREEERYNG